MIRRKQQNSGSFLEDGTYFCSTTIPRIAWCSGACVNLEEEVATLRVSWAAVLVPA